MVPFERKFAKKRELLAVKPEIIIPAPVGDVFLKETAYPAELELIVRGTKRESKELVKMYFCELKVMTEFPEVNDICPTEEAFIAEPDVMLIALLDKRFKEDEVL